MLINRGLVNGQVVTFKLVTGDEILARLEEDGDTVYRVSKPHVLMPSQQGLAMMPYVMSLNDDQIVEFRKTDVMFAAPTRSELVASFTKATTGIEIPVQQ